jgi:hypothetical protein
MKLWEAMPKNFSALKSIRAQLGLDALEVAGGSFVVLGILLGIGAYVLAQVNNQVSNTTAQNIITNTLAGVNQFSIWLPIIAIVIAAAIVLGIVLMTLGRGRGAGHSV